MRASHPQPSPPGTPERRAPGEPAAVYLLVYHSPETPAADHGVGWTLMASQGGRRCWSTSLAARGAGAHAGPRVAKAVAERILAEREVTVEDWSDGQPRQSKEADQPATFRAHLRTPGQDDPAAPGDPSGRPRIRTRPLRSRAHRAR